VTANVPIVDVALGFRPHTGWTVAVAVGGDVASPRVVERRVIAGADREFGQLAAVNGNLTPVSSSESVQSRFATSTSEAAAVRPTSVG
jgi:hypothetical protein